MAIVLAKWALSNSSFGVNPEDISNHRLLLNPKIPSALASSIFVTRQLLGIRPLLPLSFWAALDTAVMPEKVFFGSSSVGASVVGWNQGEDKNKIRL